MCVKEKKEEKEEERERERVGEANNPLCEIGPLSFPSCSGR